MQSAAILDRLILEPADFNSSQDTSVEMREDRPTGFRAEIESEVRL